MIRWVVRLGIVAAAAGGVLAGYATWRIWEQGRTDEQRPAGAIVVLGAAQYDGRPSPVFAARLDHAVELYLAGVAPYLVVTGGKQAGDRTTEAATAREYALARGVREEAILMEDEGRTTLESLRAVARVLHDAGVADAVFVSDPTHMFRVLLMARDEGVTGYGSPTRTSPVERDPLLRIDATVHELGALAQYVLTGRNDPLIP